MLLKSQPAGTLGKRKRFGFLPTGLVLSVFLMILSGQAQPPSLQQPSNGSEKKAIPDSGAEKTESSPQENQPLDRFLGLKIVRMQFAGVDAGRFTPLPDRLAEIVGTPVSSESLARSLRAVYASGLFDTVEVQGQIESGGVALVFKGTPRTFVGTVNVIGAKGATINAQLERASRLSPGARFTETQLDQAMDRMRQTLADNGYHEPTINDTITPHPADQLVDIVFTVASGPQARVGDVQVNGDSGMSVEEFRRLARLRPGAHVDHDTVNRALNGILKHFQKQDRLEAEIKVEAQNYMPATKRTNFIFTANRGPVVKIRVEGAGVGSDRLKHAIPVYEEGTVDEDLLNEGNRRLRDYFQRLGYFDVKVDHQRQTPAPDAVTITYTVTLGLKNRVDSVSVTGNHYFAEATLKDLLTVRAADVLDRHGFFSQSLLQSDVSALEAVYQNNGFSSVKVTPKTNQVEAGAVSQKSSARNSARPAGLAVVYQIEEGAQQRVGAVTLDGNEHVETAKLIPLMNTAPGQLLSPQNLAGDRDTLLTDYLNRGFDQARVDVDEQPKPDDPNVMNIIFHITEGQQVFVRKVLLTGLVYTRPDTVANAITLHPGDPLNQTALLETQRNLYNFALFNEVNAAVQNPNGGETQKTVLLQTTEARRWTVTYGLGFETQTGTPQNNCAGFNAAGAACSPNGKTGISPRVLGDVTRNGLFGRDESASIQGNYGLLEQKIDLIFQNPHFFGKPNFGLTFSGGYANSQDVTTYVASKLDAGLRWSEHFSGDHSLFSRANTFIYEFDFRRVKVAESSLQVFPTEIPILAAAVRVAGPGFTWLRDTRDSPLDAHRGTYTSFQEFLSVHTFGSEAQFNRVDLSNSSFYGFDKNRFVLARNSRYAQERAFGTDSDQLIPLPERLYAGGPTSLRGFSWNGAGPRDPETGFPIGGAGALVNSTELRLPPPTLPWVGDSVSFVLFHDMGNVFTNAGDAWVSALRIHQPERDACKIPTYGSSAAPPTPSGPDTSTGPLGQCDFNYFSHAAGLGLRYHTPVGPIRLDFSYNLNPPIYPINVKYSLPQPYSENYVGEASHFNFFFSLGQTF
ncbi:MAG TPA: POTRA domain-containing protein [Terracidiphilus sp.]|nr:POTRA domain-containing protein [Terracidiphilus sp.]